MGRDTEFTVDVRRDGTTVVVAPAGEIDLATADNLRERLREACNRCRTLVLDLRRVRFLDTSGLQLVLEQQRVAAEADRRFVLVRGEPRVQRLFDVAGLSDRLTMVDDPREAAGA